MNTPTEVPIQFDTAKFNEEVAKCRASQMAALEAVSGAIFKKHFGIGLDAPPELLRLALGKTDVSGCLEQIIEIRRNRNLAISNNHWQELFKAFSELAKRSGPMSDGKLQAAREGYKLDLDLVQKWVADPNHPRLFQASLCFYTWEALAKIVYWFKSKKPLPLVRLKDEPGRIKKQCQRLGLRQSELRLIKDVEFKRNGLIQFVPFKQHLSSD